MSRIFWLPSSLLWVHSREEGSTKVDDSVNISPYQTIVRVPPVPVPEYLEPPSFRVSPLPFHAQSFLCLGSILALTPVPSLAAQVNPSPFPPALLLCRYLCHQSSERPSDLGCAWIAHHRFTTPFLGIKGCDSPVIQSHRSPFQYTTEWGEQTSVGCGYPQH